MIKVVRIITIVLKA